MKTIDFSYFIERYNAGEMNEAEKEWFLMEMEGNRMLREEVELRANTDRALRDASVLRLRNKLNEIEKQRAETTPPATRRKHSHVRYAAAIAVLVMTASLFLLRNNDMSAEDILDRYYQPYEAIATARSAESVENRDYITALEYYNIHDFGSAAGYFRKILDKDPGNMESTMLYGVSNFEVKNYPVASNSFDKVIGNNDNLFIEDAQWYLALCYIQTGENMKAAEELQKIVKSESIYRKDARKILRQIR
jgi:tetratricopeptide (TPR) repeat protein